jgi:Domain of unknown function (DUF6997)
LPTKDERWRNVIEACKIDLTRPVNFVSMDDITKYGGMETRKMVSMDTEAKNVKVFRDRGLFVLPVSIRKVAIVRGKGYESLDPIQTPLQVHRTNHGFPEYLKTVNGEAPFINYAYACGLFGAFTGRRGLHLGFQGKKRTSFTFRVDGHAPLSVEGAQIEVDNSYSDDENFYLCEGKYTPPQSFNIRQLYYPFRTFVPLVKPKPVKNLFFAYEPEGSEFHFWEYKFADPEDYETVQLVRSAKYRVEFSKEPDPLRMLEVQATQMEALQANNVFFLMDIPHFVADGVDDSKKISEMLAIDVRQGQYYGSALVILGLLEKKGTKYRLTREGERYINLQGEARTDFFVKRLMENPAVNEALNRVIRGNTLTLQELMTITKNHDARIGGSTVERRARCLLSYFKFISDVMGYCKVENGVISLLGKKSTLDAYR